MFAENANPIKNDMKHLKIFIGMLTFIVLLTFVLVVANKIDITNLHNSQESYNSINKEIVDTMRVVDKKVWATTLAHNTEVESWFMGNEKINNISASLWHKMGEATEAGNLTFFNGCIDVYDEVNTFLMPSINRSRQYVEGFVMLLYDKDMNEIGFIEFKEKSAEYSTAQCGRIYYDKDTDTLTYEYPKEVTGEFNDQGMGYIVDLEGNMVPIEETLE